MGVAAGSLLLVMALTPATRRQPTLWGFEWRKSSTRCGLHLAEAGPQWAGAWKCHLANTDSADVDKIRAEAWLNVSVATPARAEVRVTGGRGAGRGEVEVVWGRQLEAACEVVTPGSPPPVLRVSLETEEANSSGAVAGDPAANLTYFPTLAESGSRCVASSK